MAKANKLVVIVGPTASGKSAIAMDLAKKYNGEIICADSRTVYRFMDIGTAKPTQHEQTKVKHHLLDIKDPNELMTVVEFKTLCKNTIKDIQSRGKVPFVVGGSGMYIDAVLFNYQFRPDVQRIDLSGMSYEDKMTKASELYPESGTSIDMKNERRLDQLLQFGPAKTSDRETIKIECKIIGIAIEKLLLKQKIESRTIQMLNNGFVQETRNIINKFGRDCPGLNTIGYKQCVEYIDGKIIVGDLIIAINKATLDYAKRQMTWFKRNGAIMWVSSHSEATSICDIYLGDI